MEEIKVMVADASHEKYVDFILKTIEDAAKVRGTGIAKRTREYSRNTAIFKRVKVRAVFIDLRSKLLSERSEIALIGR